LDSDLPNVDLTASDIVSGDDGLRVSDDAQRRNAAASLAASSPLDNVDPAEDVVATGDGFGLSEAAQRRAGAVTLDEQFPERQITASDVQLGTDSVSLTEQTRREFAADRFEQQTPLSEIDPDADLTSGEDGFTLSEGRRREAAAIEFDSEFPDRDITASDVTLTDGSASLTETARRRFAASDFAASSPLDSVDPATDLTATDDGFALTDAAQREAAAIRLSDQFDNRTLEASDVALTDSGATVRDATRREFAADRLEQQTALDDVDPAEDVVDAGDGFELSEDAQFLAAGARLRDRSPYFNNAATNTVGEVRSLLNRTGDGQFELSDTGRVERATTQALFNDTFDLNSLSGDDVRTRDDGTIELTSRIARSNVAQQINDGSDSGQRVTADDVTIEYRNGEFQIDVSQ